MSHHLAHEVESLHRSLLEMAGVVEESVVGAVKAFAERDRQLARKVIASDGDIDRLEVRIEKSCLRALALYQPVAADLRFVVAVLKINTDLERIGDLAVNIAERAVQITTNDEMEVPFDVAGMAQKAIAMLTQCLDALVQRDVTLARSVCAVDREVDGLISEAYRRIQEDLRHNSNRIETRMVLLSVARHLERIADLATNIAEDVIYLVDGQIVRHRIDRFAGEGHGRSAMRSA